MDRVASLLNRPRVYYNIDGVGELGMGFMLLGYALLGLLQAHTSKDAIWHTTYGFLVYLGVMCLVIHYGSKAIKQHITYPRTGFVAYRKRDTLWIPMSAGFGISVVMSAGLVLAARSKWNMTSLVALIGLAMAAMYAYRIATAVQWKWFVVLAMVAGSVLIAFSPAALLAAVGDGGREATATFASFAAALRLWEVLFGAMFMISGGISFWLYLRHTSAPARDIK
ncbi:MAG: hypothetical protein JST11_11950 [Acidobacteria bacterium]|nr:hypothetical protein [Acidobacteriota bacterium]